MREDYHGINLVPDELEKSRKRLQRGQGLKPEEIGVAALLEKTKTKHRKLLQK
jgi:hypothetical protein